MGGMKCGRAINAPDGRRTLAVQRNTTGIPLIYFIAAPVCAVSLALVCCIWFSGCASHRAYFGHASTDLGVFQPGTERTAAEVVTGIPERIEAGEQGYTAYYVYDRGYVGRIEAQHTATKIAYVPIMAWGELLTLGLLGAALDHCQEVCQKGQLAAHYDLSDRLVTTESAALPDTHPLLDGCTYNAPASMFSFCMAIRDRVRPSTLAPAKDVPIQ